MTKPKPSWVKEPVFAVGDDVWLYPNKREPTWRLRGKITKVERYGTWGQTCMYSTDICADGRHPARHISAHWLKPVDALILLAEVEHGHE